MSKVFIAKAVGKIHYRVEIEAETEEEAREKAEVIPYDEWEVDESSFYYDTFDDFEVTSVEEDL